MQTELTRYLSDNWAPIIERDVDGPDSLPRRIDAQVPNLGKLHATRRVARTIYLGSAPTAAAAQHGLEEVTKLAEDRAEQLKRDPDKVANELDERLRADLRQRGDFSRFHALPRSGADVPDDLDARLVVLPAESPYSKETAARPRRRRRRSWSRAATRRASTRTRWSSSPPTGCACRTSTRRCGSSWRGNRSWPTRTPST